MLKTLISKTKDHLACYQHKSQALLASNSKLGLDFLEMKFVSTFALTFDRFFSIKYLVSCFANHIPLLFIFYSVKNVLGMG